MVFKVLQLPWHVAAPSQPDLTIRRLEPRDRDTFVAHLHELTFDDFRDRFNGVVSDHWLIDYVEKSLAEAIVLGAFDGGHLVAVSELHCEGGTPDGFGESAFSVASSFRRKGIGTLLITALLEAANENDVHTVIVETGPQNVAMRELARKFGASMHYEDSMSVGQIDVAHGLETAECSIAKFKPIVFQPARVEHLKLTA
ncbi:GNAT family N-acetyltransferase [Pseudohoeflea suaedae]|nr:GNAT family N-acetyltransferase [Pseudohoeflea suaedae]